MDCLDSVGSSRKAVRRWFKLNQNTQIQVNTAAGVTEAAEAGDLLGHGRRAEGQKELQINPLKFGDSFTMTRRTEDRYLGMYLQEDGTAASVAATVGKRTGKFKEAAFEIRSVIEDFSMQTMGGMMAAKVLLERALLPSLMSGACNWIGVKGMVHLTQDMASDDAFGPPE